MLALPPAPVRPPSETLGQQFAELGTRFELDRRIVAWFTSETGLRASSLQDFAHLASKEEDLDQIPELADIPAAERLVQRSRVKQAWVAVRKQVQLTERTLAADEDPDLDRLLPEATLKSQATSFYTRYHLTYPPEEAPADALVSRVTRELTKRQLTVKELQKVRTQAQMAKSAQHRVQLGGGVSLLGGGEEVAPSGIRDVAALIRKARVLMRAMAMAGSGPCEHAGGVIPPQEARGTETTDYIEFPLDLGMRVCWRMEAKSAMMPYGAALAWVSKQFDEEQRAWVDRFRNSSLSIGKVVLEVFLRREAMWEPPPPPVWAAETGGRSPPAGKSSPKSRGRGSGSGPYGPSDKGKGKQASKDGHGAYAHKTPSGETICSLYNFQKCTRNRCTQKHVCAVKGCFQSHPATAHQWGSQAKGKGGKPR